MKPLSKLSFITLCFLLIGNSMSYGQVNIKERVEINSSDKNVLRTANEDYPPILINVISPSPTNITVTGPGVKAERSGKRGEANILEVPAANGTYHVTVYVYCYAGKTSQVGYSADWNDNSIASDGYYVSGGETNGYVPATFSFNFNQIPELNDFSIFFAEDEISGPARAPLRTAASGIKVDGINLKISLQDDGSGAVIYNDITNTPLGVSTTTTFADLSNLSIRFEGPNTGERDKTVVVTSEAEGMISSDTLTINFSNQLPYFVIDPLSNYPGKRKGEKHGVGVYTQRKVGHLQYEYLPENIKYNFVITKGQEYGYLRPEDWPDDSRIMERGTEFYDMFNYMGSSKMLYYSYASPTLSTDTVVINISTTDPSIEPVDIEWHFMRNPVYAYPVQNRVAIGETSQIIIKYFTKTGEIVDFPEDKLFYIELWEGYDYGTLYSSAAGYTDYYFDDVPGDFSFIAADEIDADSVSVHIFIAVNLEDEEGTSAQNLSAAGNNLSRRESFEKIRNELIEKRKLMSRPGNTRDKAFFEKDNVTIKQSNKGSAVMSHGDWYYSDFEIIITKEKKEEFYVKAEFETGTVSPGDTVNVMVKKVDEDGNEYDFDPSTTFEVGLKYGCGWSYILNADGEQEEYFASIKAPIRLIINDPPSDIDTLISLRVGVPSTADTLYKPYDELLSQQLNITEGENTKHIKQNSREVTSDLYCSVPDFLYPGYGMAVGIIVYDCSGDPKCDGPRTKMSLLYIKQNNGFSNEYICVPYNPYDPGKPVLGVTAPSTKKMINTIEYTICFDTDKNAWRFNIPQIEMNVISDLCSDNFDHYGFRRVDKLEDIPERFVCDALVDINKHYELTMQRGDYALSWVMMKHEDMHRMFYELIFNRYIQSINIIIDENVLTCEDAKSEQEADSQWPFLSEKINNELRKAKRIWNLERGEGNETKWNQHEYDIHHLWPVKWEILSAWYEIHNLYRSWVWCN